MGEKKPMGERPKGERPKGEIGSMADAPVILSDVQNGLGCLTINRPDKLNALNLQMVLGITTALVEWRDRPDVKAVWIEGAGEKAFCAGGDIRSVWYDITQKKIIPRNLFFHEYRLNHLIKKYPKPYIAWMDGITMGGGAGVSFHGSHPIATEKTVFAMPESTIGLFPDIGASYFLNRIDRATGRYLGLTGAKIRAFDLIEQGLVPYYIPSGHHDEVKKNIIDACAQDDFDPAAITKIITAFTETPSGPSILSPPRIAKYFASNDVVEILDALGHGTLSDQKCGQDLAQKSPFSLQMFLYLFAENHGKTFEQIMQLDYLAAQVALEYPDFVEGVRALLIDKDHQPKWAEDFSALDTQRLQAMLKAPTLDSLFFLDTV